MSASTPQSTTPAGLTCINCEYDLAGLTTTSPCPECATPIEKSLHGPLLRFASPDALRTADRATRYLRLAVLVAGTSIVVMLCGILVHMLAGSILIILVHHDFTDFTDQALTFLSAACGIGIMVAALIYTLAVVMLTSPALSSPGEKPLRRNVARYALLLFIPAAPLAETILPRATTTPGLILAHTLGVVATLSLMAHYVTFRQTMISLARRCVTRPKIKSAGIGAGVATVILLASEFDQGWASRYIPFVLFFLFIALDPPIRELRRAVRTELAQASNPPAALSSS